MGFFSLSMFCCVLLCVPSGFAVILVRWEAGCFAWFVFMLSHDCCVALPYSAIGLSGVCDCGISHVILTCCF